MTSDETVVLVTVSAEWEASLIANALNERGIRAETSGALTAGFRAEAPGVVRVLVPRREAERASQALSAIREGASPAGTTTDWACTHCHASIPAGFDRCWKCGASRTGAADPGFVSAVDAHPRTHCSRCGYDLAGLPPIGSCPECGSPIHEVVETAVETSTTEPTASASMSRILRLRIVASWLAIIATLLVTMHFGLSPLVFLIVLVLIVVGRAIGPSPVPDPAGVSAPIVYLGLVLVVLAASANWVAGGGSASRFDALLWIPIVLISAYIVVQDLRRTAPNR